MIDKMCCCSISTTLSGSIIPWTHSDPFFFSLFSFLFLIIGLLSTIFARSDTFYSYIYPSDQSRPDDQTPSLDSSIEANTTPSLSFCNFWAEVALDWGFIQYCFHLFTMLNWWSWVGSNSLARMMPFSITTGFETSCPLSKLFWRQLPNVKNCLALTW
jgi:hypothetical protein